MARILTKEDRKRLEDLAKMMGLGKALSKAEHAKLVKGKKIIFSKKAKKDIEEMCH